MARSAPACFDGAVVLVRPRLTWLALAATLVAAFLATPGEAEAKAKNFRKKKLARTSAVPSWFKRQNGRKSRVISGAARVARYRPAGSRQSTNSFH